MLLTVLSVIATLVLLGIAVRLFIPIWTFVIEKGLPLILILSILFLAKWYTTKPIAEPVTEQPVNRVFVDAGQVYNL